MVDRRARDLLAENFRHLLAGHITNDVFEARLVESVDPGVTEVFYGGIWPLYDDMHEQRISGKNAIRKEQRKVAARYILFLRSDLEYRWPLWTGAEALLWRLFSILTLGFAGHWRDRRCGGNPEVWPFFSHQEIHQLSHRSSIAPVQGPGEAADPAIT